jgi:hypothetical protein
VEERKSVMRFVNKRREMKSKLAVRVFGLGLILEPMLRIRNVCLLVCYRLILSLIMVTKLRRYPFLCEDFKLFLIKLLSSVKDSFGIILYCVLSTKWR